MSVAGPKAFAACMLVLPRADAETGAASSGAGLPGIGILSETERKNGWQLAEHAGEARPDGMQRLLSSAVWDTDGVRDDLRSYVLEQLGQESAILVIE